MLETSSLIVFHSRPISWVKSGLVSFSGISILLYLLELDSDIGNALKFRHLFSASPILYKCA